MWINVLTRKARYRAFFIFKENESFISRERLIFISLFRLTIFLQIVESL